MDSYCNIPLLKLYRQFYKKYNTGGKCHDIGGEKTAFLQPDSRYFCTDSMKQHYTLPGRLENLAGHYRDFCLFETGPASPAVQDLYHCRHRQLAGIGCLDSLELGGTGWEKPLDDFLQRYGHNWIMGHISYDFRLLAEPSLKSNHNDEIGFGIASFFVPEFILLETGVEGMQVIRQSDGRIVDDLSWHEEQLHESPGLVLDPGALRHDFRAYYHSGFQDIQKHLMRGDIYEMNFCLPYSARGSLNRPAALWRSLCTENPNPFRALYRRGESWLLCNSPERFLCQRDGRLISQPIKGTAARFANTEEDRASLLALGSSEKERSENVMIVDLVRNDLGRIAKIGTVRVDELFGLYTFPSVHQMISTLSAEPAQNTKFSDILKALFPMGSMTGAPKYRAMQLIDELEGFNRGLYSGSVGYIAPGGDFDFNVVIRSILYNEKNNQLLFPAGSAVTVYSNAEDEFRECRLKASRMLDTLLRHSGLRSPG